jgi:hypothetical protein
MKSCIIKNKINNNFIDFCRLNLKAAKRKNRIEVIISSAHNVFKIDGPISLYETSLSSRLKVFSKTRLNGKTVMNGIIKVAVAIALESENISPIKVAEYLFVILSS